MQTSCIYVDETPSSLIETEIILSLEYTLKAANYWVADRALYRAILLAAT